MNKRFYKTGYLFVVCICVMTLFISFCPGLGYCVEEGQPEEGINWIVGVGTDGESYTIDEYKYQTTRLTRYYTQNGGSTNSERFVPGLLVSFVADEEGALISLRDESGLAVEYSQGAEGPQGSMGGQDPQRDGEIRRPQRDDIHKEGGVWKN